MEGVNALRRRAPVRSFDRMKVIVQGKQMRLTEGLRRFAEEHVVRPLRRFYDNDAAEGEGDMPYPPDYPKMPGEPKRVQPSRDRDRPRQ